jgi:hypothetical protein
MEAIALIAPAFAAGFWERGSFNRAISADQNGTAEKRVARNLPALAAVELQNNFMRPHAQIIRIRLFLPQSRGIFLLEI